MPSRVKKINNHEYLYYVSYKDGKKIDAYCGINSKPESKQKAIQFELMHLKQQRHELDKIIHDLEKKFNHGKSIR